MATTNKRRPRKTAATTAERAAKVNALRDRLNEWQEDADPAMIAMALASHDGYSDRNSMLIAMQMPTATDVAGFHAWQDRGRRVKRGEHGIQILAPAGKGRRDQVTTESGKPEVVAEWTAPGVDPNAPGIELSSKRERQFFRIAYVFDVSQTLPLAEWEAAEAERKAAQAAAGDDDDPADDDDFS